MRCLLVSTLEDDVKCLGLLYIYQSIISSGRHDIKLIFLTKGHYSIHEIGKLAKFIRDEDIEVIAFSVMTSHFKKSVVISRELKKLIRGLKVVWGGIHPTLAPEECIPHVDYVCIGEGEIPMLELLDRLETGAKTDDLENFWINNNGKILKNSIRFFRETINLPFPKYEWENFYIFNGRNLQQFSKRFYKRLADWHGSVYSVIATRGCPFSCAYCCNSMLKDRMYGRQVRRRRIENIIKELEFAKKDLPFTKMINFQDDCFLAVGMDQLREFCKIYKQRIRLPFFMRSIPNFISDEKIILLKDAGLVGVSLGLQTADDDINRNIYNRQIDSKDFERAAGILNKNEIWGVYDVILQGPYDTEESNYKTAKLLSELPKPFSINLFYMTLFPGTPLYERCKEDKLIGACNDPYGVGYTKGRRSFYSDFIELTPFMPRSLLRYFLSRRNSRIIDLALYIMNICLYGAKKLRRCLEFFSYSDKLVQKLFAAQTRLFNK